MRIACATLMLGLMISTGPSPAGAWECGAGAPPECFAAQAREKARQREQWGAGWVDAVDRCAQRIKQTDYRFDAYPSGPGKVQMLGTTEGRYAFKKCLAEAGLALD